MDSDYHKIKSNNSVINPPKSIKIGNHVWIGCRCTILKGIAISDDVIIGANSLIAKSITLSNCVVSGNGKNVTIIKDAVSWET